MITHENLKNALNAINNSVNVKSKRYGKLLNWQGGPIWHYGIGLSDDKIFDTGQNLEVFSKTDAKYVLGMEHLEFNRDQTIERLKHALECFKDWNYSVFGWNCEHLARLVTTNDPISYGVKCIPFSDMFANLKDGRHKTALQVFNEFLSRQAPHLIR